MNPFALGAGGVTVGRHLTLPTLLWEDTSTPLMFLHPHLALCVKVELVLLSGVPDVGVGLQENTGISSLLSVQCRCIR